MSDAQKLPATEHFPSGKGTLGAAECGFSLAESLVAICVFGLGLMFVGRMMFDAIGVTVLARSKGTAIVAAENRVEILAAKYHANPADSDLTIGSHGPVQVEVVNPVDSSKLNRFNVSWTVANVPDPRAGKVLKAVQVTVTVRPIGSGTTANNRVGLNKVINLTSIISLKSSAS